MPQHEIVRKMTPNSLNSPPRQTESIQHCSARPVRPSRCVPRVGHPVFPDEHSLPRAGHSPSMYVPPEVSPMAGGPRSQDHAKPMPRPGKRKLRPWPRRAVVTAVCAFFLGCSAVCAGTGVRRRQWGLCLGHPCPLRRPARTGCAMVAELASGDASSGTGHQALKSPSSSQHTRAQAPRTQPHGIWKLLHGTPTLIDEAEETRKIEEPLVGRGNLPGCWRGSGDLLKTQPPTNGPAARPCLHPRR